MLGGVIVSLLHMYVGGAILLLGMGLCFRSGYVVRVKPEQVYRHMLKTLALLGVSAEGNGPIAIAKVQMRISVTPLGNWSEAKFVVVKSTTQTSYIEKLLLKFLAHPQISTGQTG